MADTEKPEDQWSCKHSPEIWDIYQQTCLTIMVSIFSAKLSVLQISSVSAYLPN